jgi:hypothetical protein
MADDKEETMESGLSFTPIETLPEFSGRKGPRDSACLRAFIAARQSLTGKIEVKGSEEELDKFYKSMVQWRNRHKSEPVQVRKDGKRIFVWMTEVGTPSAKAPDQED